MMRVIGVKFVNPHSIVKTYQLDEETKAYLGLDKIQNRKTYAEYFIDYFGSKATFDYYQNKLDEQIKLQIDEIVKPHCGVCCGKIADKENSLCQAYFREAQLNIFLASKEYIQLVEQNKNLLPDKKALRALTKEFYMCFLHCEAHIAFDLHRITMHLLNEGFLTLSQRFANSPNLQSLEWINDALDELNTEALQYQTVNPDPDPYHIAPQKRFFKDKRRTIKENIEIERLRNTSSQFECKTNEFFIDVSDLDLAALPMLKNRNIENLLQHLAGQKIPYQIAYLNHLKAVDHLLNRHRHSRYKVEKILAKVLKTNPRTIKGNLNVLNENSNENKSRYTAHIHKDEVENHYKNLK